MLQPRYSPNIAPSDFFLFQKVKPAVKGHDFESTEDIHPEICNAGLKRHLTKYVPGMLQWQHLEKACAGTRGVL
jgi:hypothetical protein